MERAGTDHKVELKTSMSSDVEAKSEHRAEMSAERYDDLLYRSRMAERAADALYNFEPEDAPIHKFVNERLKYLFPDDNLMAYVASGDRTRNAYSLMQGTIVINRGLLKSLKYVDRLDFILDHEARHALEQHIPEKFSILEDIDLFESGVAEIALNEMRTMGKERVHEYRADLVGMTTRTDGKINPAAARNLFMEDDQGGARDEAHGGNIDRAINIGLVSQMIDFAGASREETPLPEWVHEYGNEELPLTSLEIMKTLLSSKNISAEAGLKQKFFESFEHSNLQQKILALVRLEAGIAARRTRSQSEKGDFFTTKTAPKLREATLAAIEEDVLVRLPDATPEQIATVITLVMGLDRSAGDEAFNAYAPSVEVFEDAIVDVETLAEHLRWLKDNLPSLNIVLNSKQTHTFAERIIRAVAESDDWRSGDGSFDVRRYAEATVKVVNDFMSVLDGLAVEPPHPRDYTAQIVSEALVNLDVRRSNQPIFDLLRTFHEVGVGLNYLTLRAMVKTSRAIRWTEADDRHLFELAKELNPEDAALTRASELLGEPLLQLDHRHYFSFDKEYMDFEDENGVSDFEKMTVLAGRARETFLSGVSTAPEFLDRFTDFYKKLEEQERRDSSKEPAKERDAGMRLMEMTLRALVIEGAPFLPDNNTERFFAIITMLQSKAHPELTHLQTAILLGADFNFLGLDKELNIDFYTSDFECKVLQAILGQSDFAKNSGLKLRKFQPTNFGTLIHRRAKVEEAQKHVSQSFANAVQQEATLVDDEILHLLTVNFMSKLDAGMQTKPAIPKAELARRLRQYVGLVNGVVDEIPKPNVSMWEARGWESEPVDDAKRLLTDIFARYDFDPRTPEDQELLMDVSMFFSDPSSRARLQEYILDSRLRQAKTVNERTDLLFSDPRTRFTMTHDLRERHIEEGVRTHDEIAYAKRAIAEIEKQLESPESGGALILLEKIADANPDPRWMFEQLMGLREDDAALKLQLFRDFREGGHVPDERAILEAEAVIAKLQESNELMRYAVVRSLLVGERGLLIKQEDRRWVVDFLLNRHVKISSSSPGRSRKLQEFTRETLIELTEQAEPDLLYFALAPIIHDQILQKTQNPAKWEGLLFHTVGYGTQEAAQETVERVEKLKRGEDITVLGAGRNVKVSAAEFLGDKSYEVAVDRLLKNAEQTEKVTKEERQGKKVWTPEQFVVKLAESLGAPGIRFLQIAGQYVDLPPEVEEAFEDVYDNVRGQSKLTAHGTIEREWSEFKSEVASLSRRIGGGSLMSAYHEVLANQDEEVVKVLNPNALHRTKMVVGVMRKAFERLAQRKPETYGLASAVIDEIEEWIEQDITYENFLPRDRAFRSQHEDFRLPNNPFSIRVPRSRGVSEDGKESIYVKREEFVRGSTLGRHIESADETEKKQIASLIVHNFVNQVIDGQVHSDVHPGNFIIGERDEQKFVAIIDRNNFLELDAMDRAMFFQLQSAIANPEQAVTLLAQYVVSQGDDPITPEVRARIQQTVVEKAIDATDVPALVSRYVLAFKREKIKLPLKLTLLAKNLNGLTHICRLAGFGSLQEALAYQSS